MNVLLLKILLHPYVHNWPKGHTKVMFIRLYHEDFDGKIRAGLRVKTS